MPGEARYCEAGDGSSLETLCATLYCHWLWHVSTSGSMCREGGWSIMALFGKMLWRNLKEEASSRVSLVREDFVGRITLKVPEIQGSYQDAGGGGAKSRGRRAPRMILSALLWQGSYGSATVFSRKEVTWGPGQRGRDRALVVIVTSVFVIRWQSFAQKS